MPPMDRLDNILGWFSADKEEVLLDTTQRCYRNTVRVIQESIQLASVDKIIRLKDTNIAVNLEQLSQVFSNKKRSQSIDYLLKANCVDIMGSLAIQDKPKGVLFEFLMFLGNIIREMPLVLISSFEIHQPIMRILWQIDKIPYKEPLLQLIHALTSKIRVNPRLFHIFFYKMSFQVKSSLAKSMKDVKSILMLKENEWVCPLMTPILLNIHTSNTLGDVARHALVDLLSISHLEHLDSMTLDCWIKFLFESDLGGFIYSGIVQQWRDSTQLVTDIQNDQLPPDALINILLLVEQLMRMKIRLEIKLECLRCCKEAFLHAAGDMVRLISEFSNVANEVRLRKCIDLTCKITTVLTSSTTTNQLKAEFIIISRLNGFHGDINGEDVYVFNWTGSLGRLFVESTCLGTKIPGILQIGDFKQSFTEVMDLQRIQIPSGPLPIPLIVDILTCFEKDRNLYPLSKLCNVRNAESLSILSVLFDNLNELQQSPIFIRYKYLLMLLIRNHGTSFVVSYIPESSKKTYDFNQYNKQRELCWLLLAELSGELTESVASASLDRYMNETQTTEVEIFRSDGVATFDDNLFLDFIFTSLASIHEDDHQNALIILSIISGLCNTDYKLADYIFNRVLPICAELLMSVKLMNKNHPFKKIVIDSTFELLSIWRKRGFMYYKSE
eukprot:NODE_25_length_35605_cov_0.353461.p5 type:complete len:669 gc:universal NODE_25_length_35605_cov_0.353461:18295-20301(+)